MCGGGTISLKKLGVQEICKHPVILIFGTKVLLHLNKGGKVKTVLNAKAVEKIFLDCLFRDGEVTSNNILAEGITMNVGFHPARLQKHKQEIEAMLEELPNEFRKSGGGGWSFLNACNDKRGNQWTGLHQRMEQLFLLGIAVGKARYLLPKTKWSDLPGGMPYIVIN